MVTTLRVCSNRVEKKYNSSSFYCMESKICIKLLTEDSQRQLLRGAEEACWAHNPKVLGSKPSGARWGISSVVERLFRIQKVVGSIPTFSNWNFCSVSHTLRLKFLFRCSTFCSNLELFWFPDSPTINFSLFFLVLFQPEKRCYLLDYSPLSK